jgi:hypothetical protein
MTEVPWPPPPWGDDEVARYRLGVKLTNGEALWHRDTHTGTRAEAEQKLPWLLGPQLGAPGRPYHLFQTKGSTIIIPAERVVYHVIAAMPEEEAAL